MTLSGWIVVGMCLVSVIATSVMLQFALEADRKAKSLIKDLDFQIERLKAELSSYRKASFYGGGTTSTSTTGSSFFPSSFWSSISGTSLAGNECDHCGNEHVSLDEAAKYHAGLGKSYEIQAREPGATTMTRMRALKLAKREFELAKMMGCGVPQ